jgi:hypothetical protein
VDPEAQWAHSRQVVVIAANSNTIDIDVAPPDAAIGAASVGVHVMKEA